MVAEEEVGGWRWRRWCREGARRDFDIAVEEAAASNFFSASAGCRVLRHGHDEHNSDDNAGNAQNEAQQLCHSFLPKLLPRSLATISINANRVVRFPDALSWT